MQDWSILVCWVDRVPMKWFPLSYRCTLGNFWPFSPGFILSGRFLLAHRIKQHQNTTWNSPVFCRWDQIKIPRLIYDDLLRCRLYSKPSNHLGWIGHRSSTMLSWVTFYRSWDSWGPHLCLIQWPFMLQATKKVRLPEWSLLTKISSSALGRMLVTRSLAMSQARKCRRCAFEILNAIQMQRQVSS